MIKKIVVIGATGMLGKPVTIQLIQAGYAITLLSRDAEKAKKIFPGITCIEADVLNIQQLINGFYQQDCVYISLSPDRSARFTDQLPEREGIQNILVAAKQCGVKRIALLSSVVQNYNGMNGFDWWIFRVKLEAVKNIKASGISYSIFYPSTFMESIKRDLISGNKLLLTTGSVAPMWFIAGDDYGKQVAKALAIAGSTKQEYVIQGPVAYTWEEAAKVITENYKQPLRLVKAPMMIMKTAGLFMRKMKYAWHICEALNKYPETFTSERTWEELGKPETTLTAYIKNL